jgi:hypothetical protein
VWVLGDKEITAFFHCNSGCDERLVEELSNTDSKLRLGHQGAKTKLADDRSL